MTHVPITGGIRLARSALWNVLGQGLPLVVAVVAIPRLVAGLGLDRFGVLTLAWVLIGYFSLFDLGLSWALTRLVAERTAQRRAAEVPPLVWTALAAMGALGLLGSGVLVTLAPWLTNGLLKVPLELRDETRTGLTVLAWSLPFVTCSAGLFGVLGAVQRFDLVSAVRVPMGIGFYVGPILALNAGPSLPLLFAVLVAVRAAGALGALAAVLAVMPALRRRPALDVAALAPLLRFGGWMTVTGAVGPLMLYLDRFVIGSMRSMSEVAFYATPYEVTSRLLLLATPVAGVLFPAFSATFASERERTGTLLGWGMGTVFLALFPCTLALAALAPELLQRWLGPEMALHSASVMRWLAAGVLVNGAAQVALALVQSCGRPDWSAKLHCIELPLYVALLIVLVRNYGVTGAAIAWTARTVVDAVLLIALADRQVHTPVAQSWTRAAWGVSALAALGAAALVPSLPARIAIAAMGTLVAAGLAWKRVGPHLAEMLTLAGARR